MEKDFKKGLKNLFPDAPSYAAANGAKDQIGYTGQAAYSKHGILSSSTTASFAKNIESNRFLEAYDKMEDRFVPQIDFSTASNFAKFGLATKYYEDAYTRVHNQYPYDGAQREKVLWDLSSSYLDKYIFENVYPRTHGFININSSSHTYTTTKSSVFYSSSAPEYVNFYGGPHADPRGNYKLEIEPGPSNAGISKANVYHTASDRGNNLEINLDEGLTIEFWMNKRGWVVAPDAGAAGEMIFAMSTTGSVVNDSYCILYAYNGAKGNLYFQVTSGSNSGPTSTTFYFTTGMSDIGDGSWHHYAVAAKTIGSDTVADLYIDGAHISEETSGYTLNPVTGAVRAAIGAIPSTIIAGGLDAHGAGYGNIVSSSFDEFRYWKTKRNAKEIGRYYIDQVNGGTNTDKANTALGVYYKFNEGITQTASIDQTILDYSGRISNGTFINYSTTETRTTGSAIIISGKAAREFKDPIIYSFHPTVKSTLADLKIKGDLHDFNNSNALINSLPSWIVEEDLTTENDGSLHNLTQIMASYLDSLYLQIEALPTLKNINYASSSAKPHFFNNRLLTDYGFNVDEILTDIDLFAYANTRDDDRLFEQRLYNIKNQIYKNIYNNLIYIYKSKGTHKSFNNLMRAMGIDQEIVRLNTYGLNTDWRAQTNARAVSLKTKYADFYNNNNATIYGYPEAGNSNAWGFISGSNKTLGFDSLSPLTIENEVIFPKYLPRDTPVNIVTEYTNYTSSLFGMHSARSDSTTPPATSTTDMTWADNDSGSFQVYAIRKQLQANEDNPDVYFMLSGSAFGELTSSVYTDVYDNSKWNFAVRFKIDSYPQANFVSGSTENPLTAVELYGVQTTADIVENEFILSGTFSAAAGSKLFTKPKRVYCGAHRTNFSGGVLMTSDVFSSRLNLWETYLDNEVIKTHSKFGTSYGTDFPSRNTYLFEGKDSGGLADGEMPRIAALALSWDFQQVTGSDSSGRFDIADFSSGSNNLTDYKLSSIVQRQHTARGDYFVADSSDVVERKYIPSSKLVPFDNINSSDMVNIVDFEGEIFTRETRPAEYFFSFEKSMYANISDEILNLFATIKDFHNLVGNPVNRYRKDYKEMQKFREIFFRRVGNTPNLDKFIRYYKWIDSSITDMLLSLAPATANVADRAYNVIESHVLERNKIETKYPTLELDQPEPVGRIKAINELLYSWEYGHAPLTNVQSDNCFWWHDRAERTSSVLTSGDADIDSERQNIKRVANSVVSGSTYALRKFTRPYHFTSNRVEDFQIDNSKLNYVKTELNPSSKTDSIVLTKTLASEAIVDCDDAPALNTKQKTFFQADVNNDVLKSQFVAPFTLFTSSVKSGYITQMPAGVDINDNHRDVYGNNTQEVLQGPFSKIHVGGKKSRKVPPFTPSGSRPEEYNLAPAVSSLTLSKRGDHEAKSVYFLDEISKRPVVIKNIKTTTGSLYHGNYSEDYQIVQTVGANVQRGWLKDNFGLVTQLTPEVLSLSGNLNFNTFARTGSSLQKVTIADRFSAPGSPEAMSPGYLDPASHTFSVYNSLNYRNITVRLPRTNIQRTGTLATDNVIAKYRFKPFGAPGFVSPTGSLRTLTTTAPLNTLLRNYMVFNGLDGRLSPPGATEYAGNAYASIHKVNRNTAHFGKYYRCPVTVCPYGETEMAGNGSRHDNGFVQHTIPQSDRQYTWITASLSGNFAGPSALNETSYYLGNGDGLAAPLGYSIKSNDMTFVSASDFGTAYLGYFSARVFGTTTKYGAALGATLLHTDFAGLNFNIYEPLTASTNLLGYPPGQTGYKNTATSWQYKGNSPQYAISLGLQAGDALLNGIILNRQGPYGWPTWKQIRGGNHPIVRNHRLTNTFSMIDRKQPSQKSVGTSDYKVKNDGNTIINLTESVVTVKYKPIVISLTAKTTVLDPNSGVSKKNFKFPFGNTMAYFANNNIIQHMETTDVNNLYAARTTPPEIYTSITDLYLTNKLKVLNPITAFNYAEIKEVIWPRAANTFLNRTRTRNNYTEVAGLGSNGYDRINHRTFWRDSAEDRLRTDLVALNSQGYILSASNYSINNWAGGSPYDSSSLAAPLGVWPLEGKFTGSLTDLSSSNMPGPLATGFYAGPKAESWAFFLNSTDKNSGELFGGNEIYSEMYSVLGVAFSSKCQWMTASCRYHGVDSLMAGWAPPNDIVDADVSASSNVYWTTNIDSGRNPWYDSYEDYCADLSKIGQSYSIIPEFNMSEHMEYYNIRRQADIMGPLPLDKFTIQGINNSSSVDTTFYQEYSNSDFINNFGIVIDDHKKKGDIKKVQMTCYGLKKLLPRDGFYPVNRTLQMATLLSKSIGSQISGNVTMTSGVPHQSTPQMNAHASMLQPFFAPGILYNTIKSGLAVDWPLYTGSAPNTAYAFFLLSPFIDAAPNYRLPFEALYNLNKLPVFVPPTNLTSTPQNKIYSMANQAIEAFFTWNGEKNNNLYELAMNNFLAESVNLFLKDGKLTSFVSRPMRDVEFKENVTYRMSVDIEKTADFLMTEGAIGSAVGTQLKSEGFDNYFMAINKRGVIYGPSCRFFTGSAVPGGYLNLSGSMNEGENQDPGFAPWTPPYFYGKSTVNLTYKNIVDDTPTPSLGTILNAITASYSNNLNNLPKASYDVGYHPGGGTTLVTSSFFTSRESPAISSMMQISSSMSLFGKTNNLIQTMTPDGQVISLADPEDPTSFERWVISTKYECPVLNFNHYTDDSKARGMWNGYGNIPDPSEGIKITLRETDPATLFGAAENVTEGSLLEKMFSPAEAGKSKSVGELPDDYEKSISECIVAIPFFAGNGGNNSITDYFDCTYSADDDKYFFTIPKVSVTPGDVNTSEDTNNDGSTNIMDMVNQVQEEINEQVEAGPGASVLNLQEKMKKYVFPPRYDFVNQNTVMDPFVMYTFEFKHRFTRQELADIWQGVMPDISMKVVPETTTLSIPVAKGELMYEFWSLVSDKNTPQTIIRNSLNQIRWMVFKVKQRAKNVYANITEDLSDNLSNIGAHSVGMVGNTYSTTDLPHSYNWPYDFCSLVELAKIETDMFINLPNMSPLEQLGGAETVAAILNAAGGGGGSGGGGGGAGADEDDDTEPDSFEGELIKVFEGPSGPGG